MTTIENSVNSIEAKTNSIVGNNIVLTNLNAATIPLDGKHLIEASAGTGKTFNITRIYLRLLLERELTVEQILLMTFTKDATQELRGRIDSFIRQALNDWDELAQIDPYFTALDQRIEKGHREFLLKRALLFLDEAAIFTIHGFCQRVLNQYAFTSGLPFNANMAANSSDVTLQACQDWYRLLAKDSPDNFTLLADFWATPESFLSSFSKAISHSSCLSVVDVASIETEFMGLAQQSLRALSDNHALLDTALISNKKGAEKEQRVIELDQLKTWLNRIINKELPIQELQLDENKMPDSFIDGKRYGRSKLKAELVEVFSPVKVIKEQVTKIGKKIDKAKAYCIVRSGIYAIRTKVIEQKQALNMLDFDDLINTLADCLDKDSNKRLATQLLEQFPVALIDEFQDTDPKQFGILQALYYGNDAIKAKSGLFLIGDPKQAIYGFRGGDIFAYLNARISCDNHWLMDTNWRSTPEMIAGYNQLFTLQNNQQLLTASDEGDGLTHEEECQVEVTKADSVFGFGIPYLPVLAGKKSNESQTVKEEANDSNKALQFVHFADQDAASEKVNQSSRNALANWCANEISTLLETRQEKAVKQKDIAILVRDGAEARDIKHALQLAGLDSVFLSDRSNLFHSPQAKQLLCLFKGILLPENERIFVAAISCGLLGYDAKRLVELQANEVAYQGLKFTFVDYRTQWQRQGFITMAIHLIHNTFDIPNANKDRCLTNVLHLCEILQAASVKLSQGQELIHWFEQQCHLETNDVEAELRLESDGDLIRIITQHGSKGLEYPYVFIPFACRHKDPLKFGNKSISYLEYHDAQGNLCLSLDGSNEAKKSMSDEAYAETIRLLYVAVTRAEKRCYILTTAFDAYHLSPLGKVLKMKEGDDIVSHLKFRQSKAEQAIGLREVAFDAVDESHSTNHTIIQQAVEDSSVINQPSNTKVSQFTGNIERDWWLSSFSAISRNIRHAGVSNPDRDNEILNSIFKSEQGITLHTSEQICFKLAKGAHTGNLLHDTLEHTDFTEPNWHECLEKPLISYGELLSSDDTAFTQQDLVEWLLRVINTPFIASENQQLGRLAQIPMNKTLRESEFYFPMKGEGTKALDNLLTDHRNSARGKLPQSDLNRNSVLKHPVFLPSYQKLSGMMHGFIDLVFEYQGKYYLCDYKSNHLGDRFSHYHFEALLDNVEQNYYDLQYLIYVLALHRYLKQNLSDYDVTQHLGGVYYLYLRGMTTDEEFNGAGIYHRNITVQEINRLEAIFSETMINDANTNKVEEA